MKIYYIDNLRLPTEKAHGIQIIKTAGAMAEQGMEVTLFLPRKSTDIKEDIFEYYQVKKNFRIKKFFSVNLIYLEKILGNFGYWLENIIYTFLILVYLIFQKRPEIIYTRQIFIAFATSLFFKNVFFEAHNFSANKFSKFFLSQVSGIIVITKKLEELFQKFLPTKRILLAYDGVDLEKFALKLSKNEAREKLKIPQDKKIILYTGHLYQWKGVETMAKATGILPADYHVYLVGGTTEDVAVFRKKYSFANLKIIGHRPYQEIPYWLRAADLAVLPNSGKFTVSLFYTSPLKLFEAMAAKIPIIASDLPSLREILDEKAVYFLSQIILRIWRIK